MEKRAVGQSALIVLVLLAIVGMLGGIVWLIVLAINKGATVVAAILAAFATVAGALIVRYVDRRKELERARREHLGPLYEELAAVLAGHDSTERKRQKVILGFMRKALVYASPSVLNAFRAWRDNLPEGEANDWTRAEALGNTLRYEAFVKAMRKDVGVSNWTLQEGDLSRAVLSDFDEVYATKSDTLTPPEPPGADPRVTRPDSPISRR